MLVDSDRGYPRQGVASTGRFAAEPGSGFLPSPPQPAAATPTTNGQGESPGDRCAGFHFITQHRREAVASATACPSGGDADLHRNAPMVDQNAKTDARGRPRSDFREGVKGLPFTENRRFSPSAARRRFDQELTYYRADAPYLTVEKCAERCRILSLLLTAALDT